MGSLSMASIPSAAIGSHRPSLIKSTGRLLQYVAALKSQKDSTFDRTLVSLVEVHLAANQLLDKTTSDDWIHLNPLQWEKLYKDFRQAMVKFNDILSNDSEPSESKIRLNQQPHSPNTTVADHKSNPSVQIPLLHDQLVLARSLPRTLPLPPPARHG